MNFLIIKNRTPTKLIAHPKYIEKLKYEILLLKLKKYLFQ